MSGRAEAEPGPDERPSTNGAEATRIEALVGCMQSASVRRNFRTATVGQTDQAKDEVRAERASGATANRH